MTRRDVGSVTYRGEDTRPNVTEECRDAECSQHYVVRMDGVWVRAFHDERSARWFAEDVRDVIEHWGGRR